MGIRYRSEKGWQVYEHPLDTIMRRCLYADRLGLDEGVLDELASLEDGGGYGTTHAVVGGRLLIQFSNIPKSRIREFMMARAERIAAANRYDRVGDLFAERILMLQWLGRDDLIAGWLEGTAGEVATSGWGVGRETPYPAEGR